MIWPPCQLPGQMIPCEPRAVGSGRLNWGGQKIWLDLRYRTSPAQIGEDRHASKGGLS